MTRSRHNTVVVNDPFARRLMARYISHRHDDVERLRAALDRQDFESIRNKGHNLFGSGSAYGLDRVSELGAEIEKKAERGNGEALAALIESLDAFIRNVRII